MTDRELLEAAAKAAGIELWHEDVFTTGLTRKVSHNGILRWNPLTDDGDALRLAVKLSLTLDNISQGYMARNMVAVGSGYACYEPRDPDPYAATRRAIVRAAAEIGRVMK